MRKTMTGGSQCQERRSARGSSLPLAPHPHHLRSHELDREVPGLPLWCSACGRLQACRRLFRSSPLTLSPASCPFFWISCGGILPSPMLSVGDKRRSLEEQRRSSTNGEGLGQGLCPRRGRLRQAAARCWGPLQFEWTSLALPRQKSALYLVNYVSPVPTVQEKP